MLLFKARWRNRRRLPLAGLLIVGVLGMLIIAPSVAWGGVTNKSDQLTSIDKSSATGVAYNRFLAATETLYIAVNKGDLEQSLRDLQEIEQQFLLLPMKEIATVEGIQALAHSITEMKRITAAVKPDMLKWKSGAAELRLAADALVHPNAPIWYRYRAILQEDIVKINESISQISQNAAASGSVSDAVHEAYNLLSEHYRVIRTAVILQSEPWKVEWSDSVLRYAGRIYDAKSPNVQLLQSTIAPLKEAMENLFPFNKEVSTTIVTPIGVAPPSWGWSAMMGSFIVTILTWVGWRRYRISIIHPESLPPERRERR
ncbi:sporulation protein YpjB [Cohnella sp. WQ 127256]|uniref:sporulation protein YpjB n=1 Tax=Cohnella sp. WQ 127256 TaxID=2938790 RepID=UPI0021185D57